MHFSLQGVSYWMEKFINNKAYLATRVITFSRNIITPINGKDFACSACITRRPSLFCAVHDQNMTA